MFTEEDKPSSSPTSDFEPNNFPPNEEIGNKPEEQWSVKILKPVEDITPSQYHPDKDWMITKFKIELSDGSSEEIDSRETILVIENKNGVKIEVPAFVVHHIMSLHLKGEEAGSTIESESLENSFKIIAEHLPAEISFKGETATFEIDVGQVIGTEGVASQKEMLEKGIAKEEDLKKLEAARDEVFRLNIEGSDEEKKKFVEEFNTKMFGNVKLVIRGNAITPFFITERQPTSKIFLVIGKEKGLDGSEYIRVRTITAGRYMPVLPTDRRFIGQLASEGIPEGVTVADLLKKLREGNPLTSQEINLIKDQQEAQRCWWEVGFVVPFEKKKEK